jgi:hypothetical protein
MGVELKTVAGLTVLYIDPKMQEVWLSGPIPGAMNGTVTLTKTGKTNPVELDIKASGIIVPVAEEVTEVVAEAAPVAEVAETTGAAQ